MKFRVLIIRNAYQQDTGGAEQYAFNQALALKRAGHTPVVVTKHAAIHKRCREEGIASVEGIWHESQEWGKHYYLRRLLMPIWYIWLILKFRIDVVHPQSRDDFVFATKAGKLLGRPVFWTDHADLKYIMDRVNRPHPRMQAWILKAARRTRKIICVSHSEKASILAVAPELEDKLVVVYNGVFVPKNVKPQPKKGKFVIGTNARLVREKGISELIEAFAELKKQDVNLELWLMGSLSGNKQRYTSQAKELGVGDSMNFIGYVHNPNDYVKSMDVFVHASYHEAFSLAIIEACMLGRAIVATNVGGTPEIIDQKSGLLVPPRNASAIKTAIASLKKDAALRKQLGTNAQKQAEAKFDFQKIVETKIIPLYERSQP